MIYFIHHEDIFFKKHYIELATKILFFRFTNKQITRFLDRKLFVETRGTGVGLLEVSHPFVTVVWDSMKKSKHVFLLGLFVNLLSTD